METEPLLKLQKELEVLRAPLIHHPVFSVVNDIVSLRIFMTSHAFACWTSIHLLYALRKKTLAAAGAINHWTPVVDSQTSRLLNSLILQEESDERIPQQYSSHYQLYLDAMKEVGANREPIESFVHRLMDGEDAEEALARTLGIPESTRIFVRHTLHAAAGPPFEVAANYVFGRLQLVPDMYRRFYQEIEGANQLADSVQCVRFKNYLDRHIPETHSHMEQVAQAHGLLRQLTSQNTYGGAGDAHRWQQVSRAAKSALRIRKLFWDGILEKIQAHDSEVRLVGLRQSDAWKGPGMTTDQEGADEVRRDTGSVSQEE